MPIRLLVCGGRNFKDSSKMWAHLDAINRLKGISVLIHGGANGADSLAGRWAAGRDIPVKVYFANWGQDLNAAGPIRNCKMLAEGKPDMVVAFEGGRGTAHMVGIAEAANVKVVRIT